MFGFDYASDALIRAAIRPVYFASRTARPALKDLAEKLVWGYIHFRLPRPILVAANSLSLDKVVVQQAARQVMLVKRVVDAVRGLYM